MEVRGALEAALKSDHPSYIRIGKKGEPVIHKIQPEFTIGKGITVREGAKVCLLSAGTILPVALGAADLLTQKGHSTQVVSFHTIKPLDVELLTKVFAQFRVVATVEEHSVLGGLGGSVAEWLSEQSQGLARLVRFGTRDEFLHLTCEQEEAREHFGLTPPAITTEIERHLG